LVIIENKILNKKTEGILSTSVQILKIMRISICNWLHPLTAHHCIGRLRSLTAADWWTRILNLRTLLKVLFTPSRVKKI